MTAVIDELDGDQLAAAILTRRLRKCIAEGVHQPDGCPRCGIAPVTAQPIINRKADKEGQ